MNILFLTQTAGRTQYQIVSTQRELQTYLRSAPPLRDQISTDEIYPTKFARYFENLGPYALTGLPDQLLTPNFLLDHQIAVIVAGADFGIGSSRVHAITTFQDAGVKLLLATSFYSVYRKNAVNLAFPLSTNFDLLPQLYTHWPTLEQLQLSPLETQLLRAGGLIKYLALPAANAAPSSPPSPPSPARPPPHTLGEKDRAAAAGLATTRPGAELLINLPHSPIGSYDIYGGIIRKLLTTHLSRQQLQALHHDPRLVATSCHLEPRGDQKALSDTWKNFATRLHWAYFPHGAGVCHSILSQSYATPGQILLFTDSHTPHSGWLTLSKSVGADEMAALIAYRRTFVTVPPTVKIIFQGQLPPSATIRDVAMYLMTKKIPAGSCLEYHGCERLSVHPPELAVLTNIAVELSCDCALVVPTPAIKAWVAKHRHPPVNFITPDKNAHYQKTITINLERIVPMIAAPPRPQNVTSLATFSRLHPHIKVNKVWIGASVGGYQEEIERACQILLRHGIAAGVTVFLQPSHPAVHQLVAQKYATLFQSGSCQLLPAACGACMGQGPGAAGANEIVVSTATRNFSGRNSPGSQVYLTSASSAAMIASTGCISLPTHPPTHQQTTVSTKNRKELP
jgi:3-isopropylmalate/(R)-2-methylmalate dehydratase large subunit